MTILDDYADARAVYVMVMEWDSFMLGLQHNYVIKEVLGDDGIKSMRRIRTELEAMARKAHDKKHAIMDAIPYPMLTTLWDMDKSKDSHSPNTKSGSVKCGAV